MTRRLAMHLLLALAIAGDARADWPANGKFVGKVEDSVNGAYGVRFLDLPSGDVALLMFGLGGNAYGYSIQRISPGGDVAAGWPADGVVLGQWSGSYRPIWHGFVVDDTGSVWQGAPGLPVGTQLIRPDAVRLPGGYSMWTDYAPSGGGAPVDAAPAPGGAYVASYSQIQRLTRAGTPAPGWPTHGIATVSNNFDVGTTPDGVGGAIVFAPSSSIGPVAQRIDGDAVRHAGWPTAGIPLSNDPNDVSADLEQLPADLLTRSGSDGFIAAWSGPYNSGVKKVKLQRFLLDGTLDPAWPPGALVAVAADSISGVTILPDGLGGAHVLWYRHQRFIRGTHVLANGAFAPGLGPQGVALPAPGSLPHIPTNDFGNPIEFVTADAMPNGGLVFAWNDDALEPTKSIRVRWLLSDYTSDPSEPAEGRLILPSGSSTELRGVRADGAGGAFVAWQFYSSQERPYATNDEIWMTRVLPSSLVGVPPAPQSRSLALSAPQPNPARDALAFRVTLPDDSRARLALFDLAGREWRSLELSGAGEHTLQLDGLGRLPAGLYLARVSHRTGEHAVRVVLVR